MKLEFNFAPFPREIWDNKIDLTQGEFRLFGWFLCGAKLGLEQLAYTDDQILSGCPTRLGYEPQPPLGMSRNAMKRARLGLIEKELLSATQLSDGTGLQGAAWMYSLNLVSKTDSSGGAGVHGGQRSCPPRTRLVSTADTLIRKEEKTENTEENIGVLPDWLPIESWNAFLEMRKDKKKFPTAKAVAMLLGKLEDFRKHGQNVKKILDQSTMNCWTGLFPVNNGNGNHSTEKGFTVPKDRMTDADDEITRMYGDRG